MEKDEKNSAKLSGVENSLIDDISDIKYDVSKPPYFELENASVNNVQIEVLYEPLDDSNPEHPGYGEDIKKQVYAYARLALRINRKCMDMKINDVQQAIGNDHLIILMKNPSYGTSQGLDRTLKTIIRFIPSKYGVIDCVNITPVVTGKPVNLEIKENFDRIDELSSENLAVIKQLHEKYRDSDVLLATGNFGDWDSRFLEKFSENSYQGRLIYLYKEVFDVLCTEPKHCFVLNITKEGFGPTGCHPAPQNPTKGQVPVKVDGYYEMDGIDKFKERFKPFLNFKKV